MCASVYLKLSIQLVVKLRSDLVQVKHKRSLAHSKILPMTSLDFHQKKQSLQRYNKIICVLIGSKNSYENKGPANSAAGSVPTDRTKPNHLELTHNLKVFVQETNL